MSPALSLHLLAAAEEGGHHVVNELPFPPIMFGVFAMLAFLLLLGFLWTFRNTLALDPHGVADAHHNPDVGRDQH
ncbi:hypothetical protein [uncultured Serinicoccus sp.]|uniref:hypothetical protein n=1 Tax=uncultured Serinicoccus sp. TaxID=735514 RepID=UPI0026047EEA|nr:hypothetical protein [uncultured Serinicoccus sp.]